MEDKVQGYETTNNGLATKQVKPTTIYVYFEFAQICEYAPAFLNSKLSVEYNTFNQSLFVFNEKIPDTNNYDKKIELFTSAIPLGKKLILGNLHANACHNNWENDIELNISLIKGDAIKSEKIILSTQNDAIKSILEKGDNEFDLQGLICTIDDGTIDVYVRCTCDSSR